MKILMILATLFCSASLFAEDIKFKTLWAARSTAGWRVHCENRDSGPKLYVSFRNLPVPDVLDGSMVLVIPGEDLFARHWPYDSTLPFQWYVDATAGANLKVVGRFQETGNNEQITIFVEESPNANGRFKGNMQYSDFSKGLHVNRDLNCRANNFGKLP